MFLTLLHVCLMSFLDASNCLVQCNDFALRITTFSAHARTHTRAHPHTHARTQCIHSSKTLVFTQTSNKYCIDLLHGNIKPISGKQI